MVKLALNKISHTRIGVRGRHRDFVPIGHTVADFGLAGHRAAGFRRPVDVLTLCERIEGAEIVDRELLVTG